MASLKKAVVRLRNLKRVGKRIIQLYSQHNKPSRGQSVFQKLVQISGAVESTDGSIKVLSLSTI